MITIPGVGPPVPRTVTVMPVVAVALTIALIGPFAFVCAHGQLDDRAEDCWRRSTHARTHARTQRTHARTRTYRYINLQRELEVGSKDSRSVEAMREQSYKVKFKG